MQADVLPVLQRHVPAGAVAYAYQLWQESPFHLVLRHTRVSKLGDFSCRPGRPPRITVNADSHPLLFLLTYVHEVAHLRVHQRFGWNAVPHGKEWKESFRALCAPLFSLNILPEPLAHVLRDHLRNPAASSLTDPRLCHELRQLDHRLQQALLLSDLPEGSEFQLQGRRFLKGKLNRTRIVCKEVTSRRNYLIAANAVVGNL